MPDDEWLVCEGEVEEEGVGESGAPGDEGGSKSFRVHPPLALGQQETARGARGRAIVHMSTMFDRT